MRLLRAYFTKVMFSFLENERVSNIYVSLHNLLGPFDMAPKKRILH